MILGIDPGPKLSAYVLWDGNRVVAHSILDNHDFRVIVKHHIPVNHGVFTPVIEMIQSFGMPVGREVFETVLMIGRLIEIFGGGNIKLVYRKDIKLHLCGTPRAKDSNIRQALIDRFGSPGTKKNQGTLYGIKADEWSALAVAVYYNDFIITGPKRT